LAGRAGNWQRTWANPSL